MFTGLIESTGRIETVAGAADGRRLRIATPLAAELRDGDSVAVDGVCLTVTSQDARGFSVDVSPETLRATSLRAVEAGRSVNLERPLRADARLGGHFVLGHVDGVGEVTVIREDGDHRWIEIEAPAALAPLLISKGSVAVDGISLTVASLEGARFGVQVIPYTWSHTSLGRLRVGDTVNLETDVLGKYVARLMSHG